MAVVRSYSAVTAQLGPTAQWRFDETGGGTAVDRADSLDGTYHGGVTFGQSGATGRNGAVETSGDHTSVTIDSNGLSNDFATVASLAGVRGVNLNQLVADGCFGLT